MARVVMSIGSPLLLAAGAEARTMASCGYALEGAIYYCVYPDKLVSVENRSFSVMVVKPSAAVFTHLELVPSRTSPATMSDLAAHAAVPGRCYIHPTQLCTLPPGRTAHATHLLRKVPHLTISYDLPRSLARNSALALGEILEDRLVHPSRRLAKQAGHCARSISSAVRTPQEWEVVLRNGITTYGSCAPVVKEIRRALGYDVAVASTVGDYDPQGRWRYLGR